jgi:RHS repeat-associated protein
MFKLRQEHMEAFRPVARAQLPPRVLADLQKRGIQAERDPASGDVIATDPRGFETRLSFYPDGLPAGVTQPSGATHRFEHDPQGRLAAITYPGGERLETRRDDRGNIAELRRPGILSYNLEHDENDRLLSARYPDGTAVRLTYHPEGPLESLTDRAGATTRYQRDPDGKLRAIVDPLGRETAYETDEEGNLSAVVFPDGSRQRYAFDPDSKVGAITTRDGGVVLQELDDKDRITAITWSDGSRTEFEFDEAGNLAVARNKTGEIVNTFDAAGHPLTETTRDGIVSYAYDPEGRLIRLITPQDDALEYEYDGDGRLCLVRDWEGRESNIAYSQTGTVAEIRYGNGLVEKQQYARVGRLQHSVMVDRHGRALGEQVYEYDLCERLTGVADIWGDLPAQRSARRFDYDAESRLIAELDPDSRRVLARFAYDPKGNLIEDNGKAVEVGSLDGPVRYGGAPIEYDGSGNMCRMPGAKGEVRCEFGADGTLHKASIGGLALVYEYDALARRVSKSDGSRSWRYGWAGHQLLWEEYRESLEAKPVRRDYLFLPDSVTPFAFREEGQTYWLQTDARGSVIRSTDQQGAVVWKGTYDSFGTVHGEVERVRQPWRLIGQYEDTETGLHYNFTRYYSPWLKSYISRDPCWHKQETTNYSYARNDPWNRADPFGTIAPLLAVIGVVAVGTLLGAAIGAGVALWTGGDPVAGAVEGGIAGLGTVVGGLLGGPVGLVVGGILGDVGGAFAGDLVEQARRGDGICWVCALQAAGLALVVDLLLLGVGTRIPLVRRLVTAAGRKLASLGKPIRNWAKRTFFGMVSSIRRSKGLVNRSRLVNAIRRSRLGRKFLKRPIAPRQKLHIQKTANKSYFGDAKSANELTHEAWKNGTPVKGRTGVVDHEFGRPIGTGPKGGRQTKVRVHMDEQGRIHGHPVGREIP